MNKTRRIDVKVTDEQLKVLSERATANNMTLSEYMLFCGMNARISAEIGNFNTFNRLEYEMGFIVKMKERGEINREDFDRLKAAIIEKYSKTGGK